MSLSRQVSLSRHGLRHGFTLLEVVISYVLLVLLLLLAFTAIEASSRPVTDATVRADMMGRGTALIARLQQEFEGAHQVKVGLWDGVTFTDDLTDEDPSLAVVQNTGRAIRLRNVNRTTPFLAGAPNLTNTEVIWAFTGDDLGGETQDGADNDSDGLVDELRLVRQERDATTGFTTGIDVYMFREVSNFSPGAVPPDPPGSPRFIMISPSLCRVEFSLRRQVDYNTTTFTKLYVQTDFVAGLNVRNMNQ